MTERARRLFHLAAGPVRDLAPLVVVVAFFQLVVLQQPLPEADRVLVGILFVAAGLRLFVVGLQAGLFPLGESMAEAFARKGHLPALLAFAFALGFATTVAEPALIAVAEEGAEAAAAAGVVGPTEADRAERAWHLRLVVALAVGTALVIGVLRILRGWRMRSLIIGGYAAAMAATPFAPPEIIGLAYDSGGVTTSTVTVPLVTALGVGLASSLRGRNPLADGFGLIALASLTPIVFVIAFGFLWG